MRIEQVEALMSQLGAVLDPLGITAFPSSKTWGIALDEQTSVLVDFDDTLGKLVLSCEVGKPAPGDRIKLYELMLRHNFHWDRTGGVRLALDGDDGNVVQIVDLAADGLDVTRLNRVVQGFADAARAWREMIKRPAGTSQQTGPDEAGIPFIRA